MAKQSSYNAIILCKSKHNSTQQASKYLTPSYDCIIYKNEIFNIFSSLLEVVILGLKHTHNLNANTNSMPSLLLKQWVWISKNCKPGVPTRPHKVYVPII